MNKEYELIITIVNKGQSDKVVSASRAGGAKGGTIIFGRGTGKDEYNSLLGVEIQPEREIVLTLASSSEKAKIMGLICEYAELSVSGKGLCFSLPVTSLIGSNTLLKSTIKAPKTKANKDKSKNK
jgi:nitrogen regulatory protein PII